MASLSIAGGYACSSASSFTPSAATGGAEQSGGSSSDRSGGTQDATAGGGTAGALSNFAGAAAVGGNAPSTTGGSGAGGEQSAGGRASAGGNALGGSSGNVGAGGSNPAGGSDSGGSVGAGAVVDLFNGVDLTGFKVYRQNAERSPGTLLSTAQALPIFKPENGAIHVYADAPDQSAQVHYTLVTAQSYSKYILTWEYKWGTKKFAPYTDLAKYPRDAGVLWHLHGDITQLWPASIEFQNKFGSTGDIFALYALCSSPGMAGNTTVFAEGGASVRVDGSKGFVQHGRSANYEVDNDWTPLRLEVNGDSAVYLVNGHVVNRVTQVTSVKGTPVTSGPIAWQAEQAEVFYRHLRIQVLP